MQIDDHVVPVESANQILEIFGITKPSRLYARRLQPAGFRLWDFVDVVYESRFIFAMDWRGVLDEFVDEVLPVVAELGIRLEYQPDNEEGTRGTITASEGRTEHVRYIPNEGDDFDEVIRSLQRLCGGEVEFRHADNAGSDTWVYAVLLRCQWKKLEAIDRGVIRYLFRC
jgi:hypothetical protein